MLRSLLRGHLFFIHRKCESWRFIDERTIFTVAIQLRARFEGKLLFKHRLLLLISLLLLWRRKSKLILRLVRLLDLEGRITSKSEGVLDRCLILFRVLIEH